MKIKIREAKKSELKEIAELKMKLAKFERRFDKRIKIWLVKDMTTHLKRDVLGKYKGKIFVAVDEETNKIVGYCTGWIQKAEWLADRKIGYGCDCFVLKSYRRRKIGTKLLKALLKWFKSKKVKCVHIEAYSKNQNAINAWKKIGFKEIEITMRKVI